MPELQDLTPRQIVAELDKYIVGQAKAKRAVAIALRNRFRREQLPEELRREVIPKNILMIGPTGVGKTEIARRLASLAGAPFVKVEATKYTEVGYVGRDVESMVRDLAEAAIRMVKEERRGDVKDAAEHAAIERIIDVLHPETRAPQAAAEQSVCRDARIDLRQLVRRSRQISRSRRRSLPRSRRRRTNRNASAPKRAPTSSAASTTCA